jgi:hypothetical protein
LIHGKSGKINQNKMEEEIEQSGYNIGYNAADDLLTLFDDESQDIIIKGFIKGFNERGIEQIKITVFKVD